MNDYYHKYIKYKTKYFYIKYGGKGKKENPQPQQPLVIEIPIPQPVTTRLTSQQPLVTTRPTSQAAVIARPIPTRPIQQLVTTRPTPQLITTRPIPQLVTTRPIQQLVTTRPTPQLVTTRPTPQLVTTRPTPQLVTIRPTPQLVTTRTTRLTPQAAVVATLFSTPKVPLIGTPSSTSSISSTIVATPSTPKLDIEKLSLERLIKNKDELVCLLSSCPDLSDYDITSRPTATMHLYINFRKKGEFVDFAHFSFHNPEDNSTSLKLGDMFEANTFHLKLDNYDGIVFNLVLDGDILKLKSKLEEEIIKKEIIKKGINNDFSELNKIIVCLEKILNIHEYKGIITNPIVINLFGNE